MNNVTKSWMIRVDERLFKICGFGSRNLKGVNWDAKKKSGMTARQAADSVIQEWHDKMKLFQESNDNSPE